MKDLAQDITGLKERISFKEKRIEERLNIKDYRKCDEIKEEVMGLRKQLRETEQKKNLLKSASRSRSYYRNRPSSSSFDSDVSKSKSPDSDSDTMILTSSPASDGLGSQPLFSLPLSPATSAHASQQVSDVEVEEAGPLSQNLN